MKVIVDVAKSMEQDWSSKGATGGGYQISFVTFP